jgi:hypothetical protein
MRATEPIPDWWTSPELAFAEGSRVGYEAGLAEALEVAAALYGPWKFDADAVVRGLAARGLWPLPPAPGGSPAGESGSTSAPRRTARGAT